MSSTEDNGGSFSVDALFAVTLLILVSASFLNLYSGEKASAELLGVRLEAKMVGEKMAAALNTVYSNEENFEVQIKLPDNLGGYPYAIGYDSTERMVYVGNPSWGVVWVPAVPENVESFLLSQENLLEPLRIFWAEGRVVVMPG